VNSRHSPEVETALDAAAMAIAGADALLIGAGAGMGVDSGLPDFRGNEGFWKAYPPFRGKSFAQLSTPHWFRTDPQLAWGFFGHRLHLYRNAVPHAGFEILRRWSETLPGGYFVFTSNVDSQFQRAGYAEERIVECHGSIHFLQCAANCTDELWPSDDLTLDVDEATIRCRSELPRCPHCRGIARPNILMFGDWEWNSRRTDAQEGRFERWLREPPPYGAW
jgi:NAD-dependent SIR2 family protein deacetylase